MVSAKDWARLQKEFEVLCDRPPGEQRAALEALDLSPELKAELASLLESDQSVGGLEPLSQAIRDLSSDLETDDLIGAAVGAYRLTGRLGAGGMGEVYLAERDDGRFHVQVAVKFVAANHLRARTLFERERQVLARLNHPAIARILDAGEDERLGAYLVMEYVDGQDIDKAAIERGSRPRQSLRWMAEAAHAVAFAHQNLVLHRDLKPAHLLITREGRLKILDFGVAGLLDTRSAEPQATAQGSFTPRYAAPEQILNQPATTRTDVYALGLILWELLANGRSAFGERAEAMAERKLEDDRETLPPVPGLSRAQQRDLRAIIHRCLARRPEARYSGPGDLAADLCAVLDDAPVRARQSNWLESGWRWCRRHRLASAALAVAIGSVVVGTGLVLSFANQAQVDRQRALDEASKALASTEFLADLFSGSTPGRSQGPDTTARELLERGRLRMDDELADQPETRAYLEWVMARSYLFLGLYDEGLALIESATPVRSLRLRNDRNLLRARLLSMTGDHTAAVELLATLDLESFEPLQRARAEVRRSTALLNLNDTEGARASAEAALKWADESEEGLAMQASAQNMLAVIAYNEREFDRARAGFEGLLRTRIRQYGEAHAETALAINNLAGVTYAQGDLASALSYYEQAAELFQAHYGVENRSFAMVQRAMGMTYRKMGDAEHSLAFFDRALEVIEAWSGAENPLWREVLMQKVELLTLIGQDSEAHALLSAFGSLADQDWQGRQGNACRWARLRATHTLPTDLERWCGALGPEPDHLRPGQDYLRARIAQVQNDPEIALHLDRALESIELISPPDPLLEEAIRRL